MLPFRSGRSRKLGASVAVFVVGMVAASGLSASPKPKKQKDGTADQKAGNAPVAKAAPSPIGGIPMPIGHEIKGLVLPDFDLQGHMRSRFEAGTAKRLDAERIEFKGLKVISFTPENTIDLQIDLPTSTFNLNDRMLESQERTTITRADFHISGDRLRFNTVDRQGTLTGNVQMVITDKSEIAGAKPK